ncbi:Thiol-disulfide oxidoreductase ResA [bacterium HR17]|uniref:Thiol-disulfide oxidoreductase ResA n=1 Tax=Candidatus Fervidibacter japonicus TaxID=2035412 RepID=A0A2H5XE86_9BACT|nr:Thiol-disulfide oxidoreductase ResA [bacterium HR17]
MQFFAVNAWQQSVKECQAFQRRHSLTFPVLVDEKGSVAGRYGVTYVPYLMLIDRDGRIRFAGRELDKVAQLLAQLVGQ